MNAMEAIYKAMDAYYDITGLHSYFVQDESDIISASAKEKNFFCKCLKTSTRALKHCDDCTVENYTQALQSMKEASISMGSNMSLNTMLRTVSLSSGNRNGIDPGSIVNEDPGSRRRKKSEHYNSQVFEGE